MDLPDPGIGPNFPALQAESYQPSYHGSPFVNNEWLVNKSFEPEKGKLSVKHHRLYLPKPARASPLSRNIGSFLGLVILNQLRELGFI